MNTNIRKLECSTIGKLDEKADYIEKKDKVNVYRLNLGQPDVKTDESYYMAFAEYARKAPTINSYGDSKGNSELRKSYATYYNEKIKRNKFSKEDVQITLGASDAIMSTLKTICNENDSVVLIEPFFADYKLYCKLLGINVISYTLSELIENRLKIGSDCKAILFSNPSNPDGKIYNRNELEKILKIAKKYDLYAISDEVYSEIAYSKFVSLADVDYNKSVIVDSASKKFSNGGSRVGAIITKDRQILENVNKIYCARISISNAEQYAVNNMFKQKTKIFDNILKVYTTRKTNVEKYLKRQNTFKYEVPDGGLFFLLELPVKDTEKFAEWTLENFRLNNQTVYVVSAKDFYDDNSGKNKVRLSFTNNSKYVIKGLDLLQNAVNEYIKSEENPFNDYADTNNKSKNIIADKKIATNKIVNTNSSIGKTRKSNTVSKIGATRKLNSVSKIGTTGKVNTASKMGTTKKADTTSRIGVTKKGKSSRAK